MERISATGVSNNSYDTDVIHSIHSYELMVKNKQQKNDKNIVKLKSFTEKEFFKGRKKSLDKERKESSAEKELDKERKISVDKEKKISSALKDLHKERATQIK